MVDPTNVSTKVIGVSVGTDWVKPALNAASATKSDTANLAHPSRGIYVGTAGDVHVLTTGGDEVTFKNLAAGMVHPISVLRVYNTDTHAVDIVMIW